MNNQNEHTNKEKNAVTKRTLYLVSTPIGNLSDISERALKVLSEADFIAAEDTRKTGLLLSRYGISKPVISYFEHNKYERGPMIVSRISAGESCALVTDAGTPAISDPGEDLVKLCIENGITVTAVPGACAAVTALTLSGLSTVRFVFEGFMGADKKLRKERLEELSAEKRTIIIYEAPHRLIATLGDIYSILGNRRIALCRELTKLNEEIIRTTVSEAIEIYSNKKPRGEYVLIIEGSKAKIKASYPENITEHVDMLISSGLDRMDAIKKAAKERGISKSEVYNSYMIKENDEA